MKRRNPFYRYPVWSLLATLVLILPFVGLLRQLTINSQVEILLSGDQRNYQSYRKIKEVISTSLPIFVSMKVEDVFTPEGIQAIHDVSEAFNDMEGFLDAKSLTHSYKPVRSGMSFDMVPLATLDELDPDTLEKLRDYCHQNPLVRNIMTATDNQHCIIWLTFNRVFSTQPQSRSRELTQFDQELHQRLKPFESQGIEFRVIGVPLVENEVYSTIIRDSRKFLLLSLIGMVVVFGWAFRSLKAAILIGINLLLSLVVIALFFVGLRFELTVFNLILLPLLGVIHLTLLTHLYLAFLGEKQSGEVDPIGRALEVVWRSSAFASLTTLVSFASLAFSPVDPVASFGKLGAIGVAILFFITFGPGLSVLCVAYRLPWLRPHPAPSSRSSGSTWAERLVQWVSRRSRAILLGTLVATIGIIIGLTQVRTDVRIEEFLAKTSPTRQMMIEMNEVYGGMNILQISIDSGEKFGITSLDFLRYLKDLETQATGIDGITGIYSFAQVIAMMNQVWEKEKPGSLRIPDSGFTVTLFVSALQAQNFPFMATLCDQDLQTAQLIIRTRNMPSDRYLKLVNDLVALVKEKAPDGATVSAQATIKSLLEADRRILQSQTDTAGMTVVVVFLLLFLLWRSVTTSLISMVANILPVALVISLTGWLNIPLNSITIMVGAIAFGIAVDDSVHFLTYFREIKARYSGNIHLALTDAFHHKGRPIFFTSLLLIIIFLLLGLSSFPPIQHFGFLGATAFLSALISIFLVVPALVFQSQK
jgi:uncharacterized protein